MKRKRSEKKKKMEDQITLSKAELKTLVREVIAENGTPVTYPQFDWKWMLGLALPIIVPLIAAGIVGYFGVKGEIIGLRGEIVGIYGEIKVVRGEIKVVQQDVKHLQSDLTEVKSEIKGLDSRLRVVEQRVISVEGKIDLLDSRVARLEKKAE